ncbi:MAG: hypothetical protein AAFY50_01335 [Cyanobacteria bacterium J06648_1]
MEVTKENILFRAALKNMFRVCEAVSLYLEIGVSNPDTLEKVVDRRIPG